MNQVQVEQKNYQMPPQEGFTVAHFLTVAGLCRTKLHPRSRTINDTFRNEEVSRVLSIQHDMQKMRQSNWIYNFALRGPSGTTPIGIRMPRVHRKDRKKPSHYP
jgi:hypothetical protein